MESKLSSPEHVVGVRVGRGAGYGCVWVDEAEAWNISRACWGNQSGEDGAQVAAGQSTWGRRGVGCGRAI
eukprot:364126-Chlamydomonas_euryale.AAC.7